MEKLILSGSHVITLRSIRIIHSRKMSCAGYVADMGEKRNAHSFCGNTEGKKTFGRPRHRWEDSIEMDLKHTQWECM
jgi:hypothetical protein